MASSRLSQGGKSVVAVEIPPKTLKRQLVRNRLYDRLCETNECKVCPNGRDSDCMRSGTIYLISCEACGDEYIGETGRPLCIRVKEHLTGKRNYDPKTPIGTHREQKHNGADFDVKVTVLAQESKTSTRKTLEAFWIHSKGPKMNRKEECLVITGDLAPYLRLIFPT
ncbi:hypothetical protein KIN20_038414 [Parelaphostrongylus tenuis]|uniref:GIY-YIG domain-containing protein n=1 Tax=Parelaphostrongylus tenuis TaxID=148309 RepID=A0AAD5N2B7_PARTN|nr:hypothetical protein KIN20_038414 [Parelaphostrongylus tenuis]